MPNIEICSVPKVAGKNEDFAAYSADKSSFIVIDGVSDKSGLRWDGKTGGQIVSKFVAEKCLSCDLNGLELMDFLNAEIKKLYASMGHYATENPVNRFGCVFFLCRVLDDELVLTGLYDVGFRINGQQLYHENLAVEQLFIEKRAAYIQQTNDIEGSRAHIMPDILSMLDHVNTENDALGYGVVDGSNTPNCYVKEFRFLRAAVQTLELFTDGYLQYPQEVSVEAWEKEHQSVVEQDPYRYLKYKAAKPNDDRTVMVIKF